MTKDCYVCRMDPPWIHTKGREKGRSSQGPSYESTTNSQSYQGSSYRSSSNSPVIQMGRRTLINKKISSQEESSSNSTQMINLEDIPKDSLLYGHMLASQKQKDSITKEDTDDIKSYEKLEKG
ncbi:hypothetical protein H5410_030573 [Solanum commersonii]|uniref:Uncharacterized protein n=1 Tax=Solanum commersonii TaxID=4109 RepID=A0A9J5YEN6_SOLCO|nr:hypothetical protein H5410_030573 [Solanum commersonii]